MSAGASSTAVYMFYEIRGHTKADNHPVRNILNTVYQSRAICCLHEFWCAETLDTLSEFYLG